MPKVFLAKYNKEVARRDSKMKEEEEDCNTRLDDTAAEISYALPPTPPSPTTTALSHWVTAAKMVQQQQQQRQVQPQQYYDINTNPLIQLADIIAWKQSSESPSPSSTPSASPPPAHNMPLPRPHMLGAITPPPAHGSSPLKESFPSGLDLRVTSKKKLQFDEGHPVVPEGRLAENKGQLGLTEGRLIPPEGFLTAPQGLNGPPKGDLAQPTSAHAHTHSLPTFDEEERSESAMSTTSSSETGSRYGGVYSCPECGKTYSTSSNLARHRQTHRSLEDKKARKCPHCDKTYVSMPAFSMHLRTHNQGCKCPHCGKCFSRPWLLQGHIRTHTGEKPFTCNVCEKAFADKSNLRAHVQTHSTAKPYNCQRCHKSFALKSYLYKHEESSCMKGLVKEDRRKTNSKNRVAPSQGHEAASQGQGHFPEGNFPGGELQRLVQQEQQRQAEDMAGRQQQLILQALQQQLLLNGVLQR